MSSIGESPFGRRFVDFMSPSFARIAQQREEGFAGLDTSPPSLSRNLAEERRRTGLFDRSSLFGARGSRRSLLGSG